MKQWIIGVGLFLASLSANALMMEFVPPNDPIGHVYTSNFNDGYASGRGIQFEMSADESINGVGLYHDLTNIDLSFELHQLSGTSGIIASGSRDVSTQGLEWIDFSFSEILLNAGMQYRLDFLFHGQGNQNFFYNNANSTFSQGSFSNIDGTLGGSTENVVMAAARVSLNDTIAVPEPSPLALLGMGMLLAGAIRLNSRRPDQIR
ncbi:MAG: hypothetical protein C9356_05205 [Oleiphilus sp.]|nr:MAG: hypothetical protein C9356_05205 [Oleiphilus sp.]